MDRIRAQATKLWETIAAPETFQAYRNTVGVTWNIAKEMAVLFWLILCLVLVFGDWFWKTAVGLGRQTRAWFDGLKESSGDRLVSDTGKALAAAGSNSLWYALARARKQLGLPEPPKPETQSPSTVEPKEEKRAETKIEATPAAEGATLAEKQDDSSTEKV